LRQNGAIGEKFQHLQSTAARLFENLALPSRVFRRLFALAFPIPRSAKVERPTHPRRSDRDQQPTPLQSLLHFLIDTGIAGLLSL
jgi:hypothetical protein